MSTKRLQVLIIAMCVISLFAAGCKADEKGNTGLTEGQGQQETEGELNEEKTDHEEIEAREHDDPKHEREEEQAKKEEVTISIGAIGDVLLHARVYETAEAENGEYDFSPMLAAVEPLLQAPDFMMANQESMPGGVELGLSTYPLFNSPQEIVRDLQNAGVDMIVGANNHTLDGGIEAVESALDFYDEIGMDYVGVYRDTEDRQTDRIVTVDGVKLGVLAYTYGTNGIPIPEGHEDVVALIEPERMVEDVRSLREKVDVVIVHLHWGNEYEREPNEEQRQLAAELSEAGVDVIFGHHPHVLQPVEWISAESSEQEDGPSSDNPSNDEPSNKETIVFYSLGNFLSGQDFEYTDIGGVATVEITKVTEGDDTSVNVHSPHLEPTLVVNENNRYSVFPMAEADRPSISGATRKEIVEHTHRY